jgi:putative colanic acid biosynthesis glycosyltransferase
MKVLQINSTYGRGSTGRIAYDIENLLISNKNESLVGYGRYGYGEKAYKIGSKISIIYHAFITRMFDRHGLGSKIATHKLIKKIKSFKPDIIHLHNIHGYYLNYEILFDYIKTNRIKTVWTLHDAWAFTGHCAYFDFSNCQKWQTHCNNCPEKKVYPTSLFFDRSFKNFENKKKYFSSIDNMMIVTPSLWLSKKVEKSFLSHFERIVINNGVDLEVFKPTNGNFIKKFGLTDKFIILGVANVWDRRKGLQYFIELTKLIKDDMIIVLVGLDDTQLKELPNSIIKIKKTNSVIQLAELYSSANVYVNPTLEDNFPTTNLESLACGTPIVAFDTGGCSEVVDINTGIITKSKTSKELYNSILEVKKNMKSFYSKNCIEKAKSNYNKNEKYKEYLTLYENFLIDKKK